MQVPIRKLCPVLSGHCIRPSGRAVQVGQPGEARAPVLEAAVVLVLVTQAGEDGAQCPCHGPISFVVIDESSVVGRDAEVTVRSFQALQRGPGSSGPCTPAAVQGEVTKVWHQEGAEEV